LDLDDPWSPAILREAYPSILSIFEGRGRRITGEGRQWTRKNKGREARRKSEIFKNLMFFLASDFPSVKILLMVSHL
jgi:hypothetical protein